MHSGLLWYDNVKDRTFEEKVRRAAYHYNVKIGAWPDRCYVHPSMTVAEVVNVDEVIVITTNTVLPDHFWLCQGEESEKE